MHRFLALVSLSLALFLASAVGQERQGYTFASVVHFVELNEGFDVLQEAFERSGLADRFAASGSYTLFAPSDEAFASVDADRLDALMNDAEALEAFLSDYLVDTRLSAQEIASEARERGTALVRTVGGTTLEFTLAGDDRIVVNGSATVSHADIRAENGTIFVIDRLLASDATGNRGGDPLPAMGQ